MALIFFVPHVILSQEYSSQTVRKKYSDYKCYCLHQVKFSSLEAAADWEKSPENLYLLAGGEARGRGLDPNWGSTLGISLNHSKYLKRCFVLYLF